MSKFDQKLNQSQKTSTTQSGDPGTDQYSILVEEIESAKNHQIKMADEMWIMLKAVRNKQFFFERLYSNMKSHDPAIQNIKLFDEARDTAFFRSSQNRIFDSRKDTASTAKQIDSGSDTTTVDV